MSTTKSEIRSLFSIVNQRSRFWFTLDEGSSSSHQDWRLVPKVGNPIILGYLKDEVYENLAKMIRKAT